MELEGKTAENDAGAISSKTHRNDDSRELCRIKLLCPNGAFSSAEIKIFLTKKIVAAKYICIINSAGVTLHSVHKKPYRVRLSHY